MTIQSAGQARAMELIAQRPECFRADFAEWLDASWPTWLAFKRETDRVWGYGRLHYSANTIIEYLRHETNLRDPTDDTFKFNDRWTSSMARLYVLLYPSRCDLFEFRQRRDGVVASPS